MEMQRESQKDRTILCKYEPTEPGDYRIEVKWSGEHVPGSPFVVMIFDTQEELARFLQVRRVLLRKIGAEIFFPFVFRAAATLPRTPSVGAEAAPAICTAA